MRATTAQSLESHKFRLSDKSHKFRLSDTDTPTQISPSRISKDIGSIRCLINIR